jgi:hypothetical protein
MKLSNQNIYNLRGCKNFGGGGAKCLWGGANNFWGGAHPPENSYLKNSQMRLLKCSMKELKGLRGT